MGRRKRKMLCALINYNNNDAKHDNNMPDRWLGREYNVPVTVILFRGMGWSI